MPKLPDALSAATEDTKGILGGIDAARRAARLSQTALAQEAGTTQSAISETLSGVTMPGLQHAAHLARLVGQRITLDGDVQNAIALPGVEAFEPAAPNTLGASLLQMAGTADIYGNRALNI